MRSGIVFILFFFALTGLGKMAHAAGTSSGLISFKGLVVWPACVSSFNMDAIVLSCSVGKSTHYRTLRYPLVALSNDGYHVAAKTVVARSIIGKSRAKVVSIIYD